MRYHHIFWDFDGMLFNSYPHIAAAYTQALADFGRQADADILMAKLKISFVEAHKYLEADEALISRFRHYEQDLDFSPIVKPYDGIRELLAHTQAAGASHYLFTHRNNLALTYLEKEGLLPFFRDTVTSASKEHFAPKPAPDSITYMMKKHHLTPADCVMVGDREIDVGSGIAAGAQGILFDEFQNLGNTAAQHRVYSIAELEALLLA
ncbi:MAG: HAD hydrolase-like protein [Clostridia bacterium]|nr:HAD hydrolase-like protein [Clostridia bacterium]